MSEYVGTIGKRITAEVVLVSDYSYESRFGYQTQTHYIYTMKDADGNVFVWKTTSVLVNWDYADNNKNECVRKGDTMQITGTIKEHSEYKGTKQTILTRCKFSLISHKPDEAEIKAQEQASTITENDLVWEMPYKQYKEHYADCETIIGSYNHELHTIKVIIREGRLKNNGVRGKHFSGYEFTSNEGEKRCYRAVSEETARKQLIKEGLHSENWKCTKIYNYKCNAHAFF